MACICGHADEEHEGGFFEVCLVQGCNCQDYEEEKEEAPRRQLVTHDQAKTTTKQHTKPCSDCPFSRKALRGWLASDTPAEWMRMAHGETRHECHTLLPQQCAGAAIYRANVVKRPRDRTLLQLPADRAKVFASPAEFLAHHNPPKKRKKR